jgi:hypothetical protein
MAGLDPAIQPSRVGLDHRLKAGDDKGMAELDCFVGPRPFSQ